MEYIDGQDLGEFIKRNGALPLDEAFGIFRKICIGMSYAHRRSVIHRDIKPGNIILTSDGIPKIVDFGLARIGRSSELSMTGNGVGTMYYMPPEQKRDSKHVDHRSDIYSLAKTFYYMLTSEIPDPVDLDELPEKIRPAINKALKPKPENRYFSIDDFMRELEDCVNSSDVPARSTMPKKQEGSCPKCGYTNSLNTKFCLSCGNSLFETCPDAKCGNEQRIGSEFCGSCGLNFKDYQVKLEQDRQDKIAAFEAKYGFSMLDSL